MGCSQRRFWQMSIWGSILCSQDSGPGFSSFILTDLTGWSCPDRGAQMEAWTYSGLCYRRGTVSLGEPSLLCQPISKPFLCPRRRHQGCVLQTLTWEMGHKRAVRALLRSSKPCGSYFLSDILTICHRNLKLKFGQIIFTLTCFFLYFPFHGGTESFSTFSSSTRSSDFFQFYLLNTSYVSPSAHHWLGFYPRYKKVRIK